MTIGNDILMMAKKELLGNLFENEIVGPSDAIMIHSILSTYACLKKKIYFLLIKNKKMCVCIKRQI